MGLLEKARQYKSAPRQKIKSTSSIDMHQFILDLFGDNRLDLQVETILNSLESRFNVDRVLINFLDDDENVFRLLGSRGIREEDQKFFHISYYSNFLKAMNKNVVNISEFLIEPKFKDELSKFISYKLKVIFPLLYKNEMKGFITLGDKQDEGGFSYNDIEEISQLNQVITLALFNSMYLSSTEKKMENIKEEHRNFVMMFENLKNINLAENLEEALVLFMKTIKDFYRVTAANVMVIDKAKGRYVTRKSLGMTPEADRNFTIPEGHDFFNSIIELGEPMLIPDFRELDVYKKSLFTSDASWIRFFYTIPVKLNNECYGLFNIFSLDDSRMTEIPPVLEKIFISLPLGLLPYLVHDIK
ncbi:MAG: GAF domain-containing protein [bacterium]|nr:GAF domain-containing protein [bacterium]